MGILIDALQESVGTVKHWVRPNAATPLPPFFVILDGSTLVDPDSPFNGMVMKDTRGQFLQGHPTLTNANFGADTNYHFGGAGVIPTGGSASIDLTHAHAAGAHIHPIGGHSHTISGDGSHAHTAPSHIHNIGTDGGHTHSYSGSVSSYGHTHFNVGGATFNNASSLGANSTDTHSHSFSGSTSSDGGHSHGGSTFSGGGFGTDAQGTHSHGGTTGAASGSTAAGSGNTSNALAVIDKTPPWWGFIAILKVK